MYTYSFIIYTISQKSTISVIFYKQSIFPCFSSEFLAKESKNKQETRKNSTRIYAQVLERQYSHFLYAPFQGSKTKADSFTLKLL